MYFDIEDLTKFYFGTSLGKRTAITLRETVAHLLNCEKGEMLLGFGFTLPLLEYYLDKSVSAVSLMPRLQGSISWPDSNRNINSLVDEGYWPVETESVDKVLVLHGLEMSLNPHRMMSEIWRILKPNGVLLIFVANRTGFWSRSDISPFGYGRPYSVNQIGDLLHQTQFDINERVLTLNGFPVSNNRSLNFVKMVNHILNLTKIDVFSGVIAIRASKALFAPEKLRHHYFSFGVNKILKPSRVANISRVKQKE